MKIKHTVCLQSTKFGLKSLQFFGGIRNISERFHSIWTGDFNMAGSSSDTGVNGGQVGGQQQRSTLHSTRHAWRHTFLKFRNFIIWIILLLKKWELSKFSAFFYNPTIFFSHKFDYFQQIACNKKMNIDAFFREITGNFAFSIICTSLQKVVWSDASY